MRRVTEHLRFYGMTSRMLSDPERIMRRASRLEEQIARDQKTLDYLLARWQELVIRSAA